MSYLKNTSGQYIYFAMVDKSSGDALTTGTVNGYRTIDGGTQASVTGTISHKGNGQWQLALSQADTNGDEIGYLFTHTSGVPQSLSIVTDTKKNSDLNDLSTTQVNAEVDTALADYDAPTKAEMDSGFAGLNDLSAAQVNAEVDIALSDIRLNELMSAALGSQPTAGSMFGDLTEDDAGTQRFNTNALEQAPSGGGGGGDATLANQNTIIADIAALNDLNAAQVNAEVDTALSDIRLNELMSAALGSQPAAGSMFGDLTEDDAGTQRFNTNALEQAPSGGGGGGLSLSDTYEGSMTLQDFFRSAAAVLYGKSSGGGTTTITFRDLADSKNRVIATVDTNDGDRTAVTLDAS